jgi:ribonuclease P protein component
MNSGFVTAERVRRRREFERAYKEGTRIHARFMTVFVVPNAGSHPRLGIAATRKLGNAADRNLAKRRTRELFRRHKTGPVFEAQPGLDIIVVPRREMLDAPFTQLEGDYLAALTRGRRTASSRAGRRVSPGGDQNL